MSWALSAGLSFLAGLLSFLSPCVFPLMPVYAGYLSGRSVAMADGPAGGGRAPLLAGGIAFVAGFTLVFVLFYYVFTALSVTVFVGHQMWFHVIAGAVIIVFALNMLGVVRIGALMREFRPLTTRGAATSGSAFVLGVSFGAGWSPCLGPQLAAILTIAANGHLTGLPFMLAYCAGLAVPFLLVAALTDRLQPLMRRINGHLNVVTLVSGGLLLLFGVLLVTGRITWLSTLAPGSPFDI